MKKTIVEENNKRKLKIAIFNWRDIKNPASGGAEIATHEVSKRLVAKGHKIIQFSSSFKNAPNYEVVDGVEIYRKGTPFTVHLNGFFFYQKNLKGRVDIIIDQIHGLPFFTPFYVKEPKIAYIHEVAGEIWFWEWIFPINILGFIFEKLYFFLYKNINFITVSQSTKADLINYRISQKRIGVINNGLTPPPTSIQKIQKVRNPTIIYLGRISPAKRIEEIIKAVKIGQFKYPKLNLWIVGTGKKNYQKYLKNLTKKLNLTNKITFYGFVSEQKKFELLKRAWLAVATSVKEGWGLTVAEAAICGTPAVIYNVGGLRDVITHNKTGIICQKNTPENLAENIIQLILNKGLRKKLGENAAHFASTFSWTKTSKEFEKKINQIVKAC